MVALPELWRPNSHQGLPIQRFQFQLALVLRWGHPASVGDDLEPGLNQPVLAGPGVGPSAPGPGSPRHWICRLAGRPAGFLPGVQVGERQPEHEARRSDLMFEFCMDGGMEFIWTKK